MPIASLPMGRFEDGYRFVDWLCKNKFNYWQVLPLAPRDDFGSPYNSVDSMGIDPAYGTEKDWQKLKSYTNQNNIKIIGDLPYFISRKERDDLFVNGKTAGAPADQFGRRGQRWGLPVYDWENKFPENLDYWLRRLSRAFELFDLVRLDHFRGYCAVWVYPDKKWLPVPGEKIMAKLRKKYPEKVFIAEDLGVITPDVIALRRQFDFLGMKVLVWDDPKTADSDSVIYTSVHDSRPLLAVTRSLKKFTETINRAEISKAKILIYAMQDILRLGSEARLNRPGTKKGNWSWKMPAGFL